MLLSVLFESCSGIIQESFINHSLIIHSGIIQESFINHHESSTDSILLLAVAPWCLDGVPDSSPFIAFPFLSFVYLCFPDRQRRSTRACACVCICVHVCACVCMCMCMCMVIYSCVSGPTTIIDTCMRMCVHVLNTLSCMRMCVHVLIHCYSPPHLTRDGFR